jgi:hypothetical protein
LCPGLQNLEKLAEERTGLRFTGRERIREDPAKVSGRFLGERLAKLLEAGVNDW